MLRYSWLVCVLVALCALGCRPPTAWSPDSKQLLVETNGKLHLFHLEASRFTYVDHGEQRVLAPTWSPDGGKLAYFLATLRPAEGDAQGDLVASASLVTLDLTTHHLVTVVPEVGLPPVDAEEVFGFSWMVRALPLLREVLAIAWSPDGERLAYLDEEGEATVLRVVPATGGAPVMLTPATHNAASLAWSPDGRQLAYLSSPIANPFNPFTGGGGPSLHVTQADGSGDRRLWTGPAEQEISMFGSLVQWSGDGERLAVLVDPPGQQEFMEKCEVWLVPAADSAGARRLANVPGMPMFLSVSADAKRLALFDVPDPDQPELYVSLLEEPYQQARRLFKLDIEPPTPPTQIEPGQQPTQQVEAFPTPVLSPDGERIAVLEAPKDEPAKLILIPTAGGEPRTFLVPAR